MNTSTLDYLLNKYNLPAKGSPIEIPNVGRLDLPRWFRELDFKVGAEIGVYVGEFSRIILGSNPQIKLFGIDPWIESPNYRELQEEVLESLYQRTVRHLYREIEIGRYQIVRKTSMDALADFKDGSLDFVYIDANHEAPFVSQDIEGWAKKVRKGGIVSGHDYIRVKRFNYDIIDSVNRYTKENNLRLFILGSSSKEPKVIRDRVRSWAFVN